MRHRSQKLTILNSIIAISDCNFIFTYAQLADIDECAEGTDECEDQCVNTLGSYTCKCTRPAYYLHSDGLTCKSMYLIL